MTTPTNLKIDALNFQGIKDNFKLFLQNQDQFRDINFESSGINALLDVLTYNTYYNSFYLNMVAGESFLATAQRRNSIVSLARSLGYTPKSVSASRLIGSIRLQVVGNPSSITLPAYSRFGAVVDGVTYNFLTQEPLTFTPDNNDRYILNNVELIQGTFVRESYTFDSQNSDQRFLLNNVNADTNTLLVRVQDSVLNTTTRVFERATNFVELSGTTLAYFLEEVEDGKFEIFFGDGIIGRNLNNQNVVFLDYIASAGAAANNIRLLTFNSVSDEITDATFTASDVSFGGQDRESIETIRFNAPKSYSAQNRLVTAEDYASFMLNLPNIGSVAVWGGEDNDPPAYGQVYVAIRPVSSEFLTATEKSNIIQLISKKKILTVQTEIVDPEYIYLELTANVKYNPNQTISDQISVRQKIIDTIKKYRDDEINQFSKYFRYSQLSKLIDSSERSILSSNLDIILYRERSVQLGIPSNYIIEFSNRINDITLGRSPNHPFAVGFQIFSNPFSFGGFSNCFLEDNNGIMRIYRRVGQQIFGVSQNIGTVNYNTGRVVLQNFNPTSFADGGVTLKLSAVPKELDVLPLRGQIIDIRDTDIKVNLEDDTKISLVRR